MDHVNGKHKWDHQDSFSLGVPELFGFCRYHAFPVQHLSHWSRPKLWDLPLSCSLGLEDYSCRVTVALPGFWERHSASSFGSPWILVCRCLLICLYVRYMSHKGSYVLKPYSWNPERLHLGGAARSKLLEHWKFWFLNSWLPLEWLCPGVLNINSPLSFV